MRKLIKISCNCNYGLALKKEAMKCDGCGEYNCLRHTYSYVDGNNGAITKNSKNYCEKCYKKIYPDWKG